MNDYETIDNIFIVMCLCVPGLLFVIQGIKVLRSNKAIIFPFTEDEIRLKEPVIVHDAQARSYGKPAIFAGMVFLMIGIIMLIARLL